MRYKIFRALGADLIGGKWVILKPREMEHKKLRKKLKISQGLLSFYLVKLSKEGLVYRYHKYGKKQHGARHYVGLSEHFEARVNNKTKKYWIGFVQEVVLNYIKENPGCTIKNIANLNPSKYRATKKLVDRGLVRKLNKKYYASEIQGKVIVRTRKRTQRGKGETGQI